MFRTGGLVALALVAAAQLVPVDRSNPPVRSEVQAPDEVMAVVRRACYDCHSNETRWPWYSRVAPVSWVLAHHVHEGRGELNFSEWPLYDFEQQDHAFHDIDKQITKGKMPLWSYTIIHRNARLAPEDRDVLLRWARGNE